jgi:hypothetical protein
MIDPWCVHDRFFNAHFDVKLKNTIVRTRSWPVMWRACHIKIYLQYYKVIVIDMGN